MTALTTLSQEILETLRQRRSAGESVKHMAGEVGVTWQKLDKAIRNGLRPKADPMTPPADECARDAVTALIRQAKAAGPLIERYRPRTLGAVVGQDKVVAALKRFVSAPYPTAFLFDGETGTGKTSTALALAADLGCDVSQKPPEFGGLHVISSGEQTADTIRAVYEQLWRCPFSGSGWKVLIVNEADRMHPAAETIWLDRLEALPPRTVIVFTTNFPDKLAPRFRDRCTRLAFTSEAKAVGPSVRAMLAEMWCAETGDNRAPADVIDGIILEATQDGQLSFRRAVQALTVLVAK